METSHKTFTPDFIGVGGEKTASTWIYKCLLEHPQICGPREKELIYFDTVKLIGRPDRAQSAYELHGIEPYLRYFQECDEAKVTGEFTATYLHDKKVAKILSELFPQVKIIISLRNPIDRSFSQYQGLREADRKKYGGFEKALRQEPEFIRRSMYSEYIEEYFKYFPKEQIYIVLQDDIAKDPVSVLSGLYEFLGVDPTFIPPDVFKKERSAEEKKLQTIRDRVYSNPLIRSTARTAKAIGLTPYLKQFLQFFLKRTSMRPATRTYLYSIFKEDIENTGKLIGRNLSCWR